MRLTFKGIRTADYGYTNISMPGSYSEPAPFTIVQGPAEISYGSFSIWGNLVYQVEAVEHRIRADRTIFVALLHYISK